jgi:hypothetical protein
VRLRISRGRSARLSTAPESRSLQEPSSAVIGPSANPNLKVVTTSIARIFF